MLALNPLVGGCEVGANTPYDFVKIAEADHEYPITKILWEPLRSGKGTANLLATTGDHLRLWELTNEQNISATRNKGIKMKALCHSVLLSPTPCSLSSLTLHFLASPFQIRHLPMLFQFRDPC